MYTRGFQIAAGLVLCLTSEAAEGIKCDRRHASRSRQHYDRGDAYYRKHNYAKAVDEFNQANLLCPNTEFLMNLGQAHRKIGNLETALSYYQQYIDRDPDGRQRALAQHHIAEIKRQLGRSDEPEATVSPTHPAPEASDAAVAPPVDPAPPPAVQSVPPPPSPAASPPPDALAFPKTAPPSAPAVGDKRRPWQRWWFWASIGGTVAVGAGVVSAIVLNPRVEEPIEGSLGGWGGP